MNVHRIQVALAFLFAVALTLWPFDASVIGNLHTRSVTFETFEPGASTAAVAVQRLSWLVRCAHPDFDPDRLSPDNRTDGSHQPMVRTCMDGTVRWSPGVRVSLRSEAGGMLSVYGTVIADGAGTSSVGVWESQGGLRGLGSAFGLSLQLDDAVLTLQLPERIEVGEDVTSQVETNSALLEEGELQLVARAYNGMNVALHTLTLWPGDRLDVSGEASNFRGFLVAKSGAAMQVILRTVPRQVVVYRGPASPEYLSASWSNRLRSDTTLQAVWGIAIFVLFLPKRLKEWRT